MKRVKGMLFGNDLDLSRDKLSLESIDKSIWDESTAMYRANGKRTPIIFEHHQSKPKPFTATDELNDYSMGSIIQSLKIDPGYLENPYKKVSEFDTDEYIMGNNPVYFDDMEDDYLTYEVTNLITETNRAWRLVLEGKWEVWLPKSKCCLINSEIAIPDWIAEIRGLDL